MDEGRVGERKEGRNTERRMMAKERVKNKRKKQE